MRGNRDAKSASVKVSALARSRRERRVEAIDSITELRIVGDQPRAGDLELQELRVAVAAADMDVADRSAGLILKIVAAAVVSIAAAFGNSCTSRSTRVTAASASSRI